MHKVIIRPEEVKDKTAVSQVVTEAFRKQDVAHKEDTLKFVDRVRNETDVCLSMVALIQDAIVGHIIFSILPLTVDEKPIKAAYLASVAILPTHQRRGIGSKLIEAGIEELRKKNFGAIFVLGYPEYYPRFGFSAGIAQRIKAPFTGAPFMAAELTPGSLQGKSGVADFHPLYTASYSIE